MCILFVLKEQQPPEHSHTIWGVATHTTRDFNRSERSPFAVGRCTELTSAPFRVLAHTHARSPLGAFSPLMLDPLFSPKQSLRHDVHQANLSSGRALKSSSSWVSPERDPKQRKLWAIIPSQFKFPSPWSTVQSNSNIWVWALLVPYWILSLSPGRTLLFLS